MISVSGSRYRLTSLLLILMPALLLGAESEPMPRFTLEHEGQEREYFVFVPAGADGPLPVVLAIHGYTSTATGFANAHELNEHAARNGYIAVYPQGTHFLVEPENSPAFRITAWNSYDEDGPDFSAPPHCTAESAVYPCPPGCGECHRCQWETCTNDLAFIERVLDEVEADFDTDTSRYYVLGVSNGAMMTTRLACDLAARFAAAAPIIGLQPPGHACAPDIDLPMLFLMGELDETIRFDGKAGKDDGFIYATLAESTALHAQAMECKTGPGAWPSELATSEGLECTAYSDCRQAGHEVVSCLDPTGTHVWPMQGERSRPATCVMAEQAATMPEKPICGTPDNGPHAGMDLVWDFFSRYRRD